MKRGRDTAHVHGRLINDTIDIFCGHTGTDLLCDRIKAGHIDLRALFDAVHMLLCLEQASIRNDCACDLELPELFIKAHMAGFIFASAPAPARIIAFYLMLSDMNHCMTFLSAESLIYCTVTVLSLFQSTGSKNHLQIR